MRVSTFNIKNDYSCYREEKTDVIYKYLRDNKIDVLGLQEVFSKCDKDLRKKTIGLYNLVGKYRFFSKVVLRRFNEKNPIITNYKIIKYKTYYLPFLPSVTKRVMTYAVIEYKKNYISIYNTHLEEKSSFVKKRQLDKIFKIIEKDNNPKIIMGDFNLKDNNTVFNSFVDSLEKMGINRISIGEKTLKQSKYTREIDHVFISKEFKVKNKWVIKDLDISDHYPVLVDIDINL